MLSSNMFCSYLTNSRLCSKKSLDTRLTWFDFAGVCCMQLNLTFLGTLLDLTAARGSWNSFGLYVHGPNTLRIYAVSMAAIWSPWSLSTQLNKLRTK